VDATEFGPVIGDPPLIAVILTQARKRRGMTVDAVSAATGIKVSSLNHYFAGRRSRKGETRIVIPPSDAVAKIAAVVGATPDELRSAGFHDAARAIETSTEFDPGEYAPDTTVAQAMVRLRRSLLASVVADFSDEELQEELARRAGTRSASAN